MKPVGTDAHIGPRYTSLKRSTRADVGIGPYEGVRY